VVAARNRRGRPPAGADGEKVKDYPQLSVRLPPDVMVAVEALSSLFGKPKWRLVDQAIRDLVANLSRTDRSRFEDLVRKKRLR
jgi:hypothetical protein